MLSDHLCLIEHLNIADAQPQPEIENVEIDTLLDWEKRGLVKLEGDNWKLNLFGIANNKILHELEIYHIIVAVIKKIEDAVLGFESKYLG